jgi:GTP-binding protein
MDSKKGAGGYLHLEFTIPARGLIGVRSRLLNATQGKAIMHHNFRGYERLRGSIPRRTAGVMITSESGNVTAYALDSLYDRGTFFVRPGDPVYEGQIVGEHAKETDLAVNAVRPKKLTNVRASGKDDQTQVRPCRDLGLEAALEYVQEDELVEITPGAIRLRKRILREADRRRAARRARS